MGLDSVEMVIEFEKYFGINIPDDVASEMVTIADAVKVVATILGISNKPSELPQTILSKIEVALEGRKTNTIQLKLQSLIGNYLANDIQDYKKLEEQLHLKIPVPVFSTTNNEGLFQFIKKMIWTPTYSYEDLTMQHLVNAILAKNYHLFIDPLSIKNRHEIYIIIIYILHTKLGIDYYEADLHKSFTTDLGID